MDNIFGERLKQVRIENHKTQEEVAKQIKITRATLSRYEKGEIEPPINTVADLANLFNVSLDWIAGNSEIKDPNINSNKLLELYNSLSSEHKIQVFSFINYLKYLTDNSLDAFSKGILDNSKNYPSRKK